MENLRNKVYLISASMIGLAIVTLIFPQITFAVASFPGPLLDGCVGMALILFGFATIARLPAIIRLEWILSENEELKMLWTVLGIQIIGVALAITGAGMMSADPVAASTGFSALSWSFGAGVGLTLTAALAAYMVSITPRSLQAAGSTA